MAFQDAKNIDSVPQGPVDHDVIAERKDSDFLAEVRTKFAGRAMPLPAAWMKARL